MPKCPNFCILVFTPPFIGGIINKYANINHLEEITTYIYIGTLGIIKY